MADTNIYTWGLQKINELRREKLSLEVINELRNLYNDFRRKRDEIVLNGNDDIEEIDKKSKRNGFEFLMNEIRLTFFYLIRENNLSASNGTIRRLENILDDNKIKIDDLVTANNHAIVIGENINYFSKSKKCFLFDEYLKEITDFTFIEHDFEKKYLDDKLKNILAIVIEKINEKLDNLGLNCDEKTLLYLNNNKICCGTCNLHIYISDNLTTICDSYYGKSGIDVEIFVENNLDEYYSFEMNVSKNNIDIKEIETLVWKMSEKRENVKVLNKNLEKNAFLKN